MREVATLAQRRRRVIAIGAALTAATFLVIVTVMINTFWRIGLGPQDLYEDHVTVVAWSVSMVLWGFAIRRRFWSKGPLDVVVAVVLGSDIGSTIWLSIWYLPHDRFWMVPLRALGIAIVGLPVALAAVPVGALGILLADLRPESRRRFG